MNPESLQIIIPATELEDWLNHISQGTQPSVTFTEDMVKMQADAYKVRGDILYYLNHRIRAFIPSR